MIELRTPAEIDAMRPAGRFVAEVLTTLRADTRVGTNLLAIDKRAHEMIRAAGAESCYICLLYTSPSPRDLSTSRMPSSA